jgi:hypothetical protein
MKECDNSKIHMSSKFILSICLLIMFDTLLLRSSLHCNTPLHFTTLHYTFRLFTFSHFTDCFIYLVLDHCSFIAENLHSPEYPKIRAVSRNNKKESPCRIIKQSQIQSRRPRDAGTSDWPVPTDNRNGA